MKTTTRLITIVSIIVSPLALTGCDGKRLPISEENRGYNQGVTETRDARNKGGIFGAAAQEAVANFGSGKAGQSSDYNSGYRQGVKDELKK